MYILRRCCSQSSIPVTDLTICGKRQVLSDVYGQVLPDRYTCPGSTPQEDIRRRVESDF